MRLARSQWCWLFVMVLTAALTAVSTVQALDRYGTLRTGWSWDLAYYNQWFWTLTQSDGRLTVRPAASYATEGPSVWKTNYLAPIRLAITPIYAAFPDPRTLLVLHSVLFWWLIPASYTLALKESGSPPLALSAAVLAALTPLAWPLAWNDFRELQLAIPFVHWAVQGIRHRQKGLAIAAVLALLACRQEFAVVIATFAFLPPKQSEELSTRLSWRYALFTLGIAWLFLGFFGYLRFTSGLGAVNGFIDQFGGPKASVGETLTTASEVLFVGLGAWAILACAVPRTAILAAPWIWSLCNGRWALRFLETEDWHHVRYAAIPVALVLAAGLIGYSRTCLFFLKRRHGTALASLVWTIAVAGSLLGLSGITSRMSHIPDPIGPEEARQIWRWIHEVGPEEGVLATYEVTAPLSSRKILYSYILDENKPRGFPTLGPEFQWVLFRNKDFSPAIFTNQGFQVVHQGRFLTILRRPRSTAATTDPSPRSGRDTDQILMDGPSPKPKKSRVETQRICMGAQRVFGFFDFART